MDHDNKIKHPKVQGKAAFLQEDPSQYLSKTEPYSLDVEFAKTRKNKNYFFYLGVISFIIVVLGGTYFVTDFIQKENKRIDIQINDFEELNLKELLTASKKGYGDLVQTKQDLADMKRAMIDDIKAANADITNQINLIREKGLSPEDERAAIQEANQTGQSNIAILQSSYNDRIKAKEREAYLIEKNISSNDQKVDKTIKKSEQFLADNRKLADLELQKQQRFYEDKIRQLEKKNRDEVQNLKNYYKKYVDTLVLKYNPVLDSSVFGAALNYPVDSADQANYAAKDFIPLLESTKSFNPGEMNELRQKYVNQRLLFKRMLKVPYTNSVPAALVEMDYLSSSVIGHLSSSLLEKNSIVNGYLFAMESYSRAASENGYVIDARNTNNVLLYMNKIYSVKNGDTALIFRSENEYIAKIQFFLTPGGIRARTLELMENKSIQPFDKVLINLN